MRTYLTLENKHVDNLGFQIDTTMLQKFLFDVGTHSRDWLIDGILLQDVRHLLLNMPADIANEPA